MNQFLRFGIALLLSTLPAWSQDIEGSRFLEHVSYLASDELGGRGVGTPGIDQAAEYIADQFRKAGLRPAGESGTYFQTFEVTLGQELTGLAQLSVSGAPAMGLPNRDFVPLPFSSSEAFEGPVAFVGYGITNPEANYDDYAGFDAEGKVLLMLRYEPHHPDPQVEFGGKQPSNHAAFRTKASLARKHGARAVLIVNPPLHHGEKDLLFDFESIEHTSSFGLPMLHVSREYADRLLKAAGEPDLATLQRALDAQLGTAASGPGEPPHPPLSKGGRSAGHAAEPPQPPLGKGGSNDEHSAHSSQHATRSTQHSALSTQHSAPSTHDSSLSTHHSPRDLKGLVARGDPGLVRRQVPTRNVIGMLPGNGPLADEFIVIGAHYDHLGKVLPRRASSPQPAERQPEIHNGADDNASGTAGVIELARAFGQRGTDGRSLLFIAFSAEEMGLLGSDWFVDHPTIPLEKIVAMLNMDMIGRLRDNRLEVFGIQTASEFEDILNRQAGLLGFQLKASGGGFGPSDHTSFYKKKIPALHFFTGLHNDYHMPGDDTHTVNAEGGAKVVQLIHNVAAGLTAAPQRPTYVAVVDKERPRTGLKVRLGVLPSYADDEEPGMQIEGASPASPAERAGLREGDRILMIGTHEVNDVHGLMDALGAFNPNDEATITVLREGRRLKLGVKFEASK
ncbi:MAG: hypothetical protein AMXMBFR13_49450 [Phycisphaerae bacterium]